MKAPENDKATVSAAGMKKISLRQWQNEQGGKPNAADSEVEQPARAVAYVRMSTDHQDQSIGNQLEVIKEYAERNSMQVTKVYADEGKSGVSIKGRNDFLRLLEDVQNKSCDFSYVLVHDTSRWGRFPDSEESVYYEVLCKKAGIKVHFCGEDFRNDGSRESAFYKFLKYNSASAFSEDLSKKVFHGSCNLARQGYRQGGPAGYGLRRQLLNEQGRPKMILNIGEKKSIQTERVILVPGPEEEVRRVKWIYETFVCGGKSEKEIALTLNAEGVKTDFGRPWTRAAVREILTKEKYIGHNVYNQTSGKLKSKRVRNSGELWVRKDDAFQGLVSQEIFDQAQQLILARNQKLSDEEMLEALRKLLEKHGRLSGILIDECADTPSSSAFGQRFGSLSNAYKLIGYQPPVNRDFIEINKFLRRQHAEILTRIISNLTGMELSVVRDPQTDLLTVSGEFTVSLVICRHHSTPAGASRWLIRLDTSLQPDFTLAARMNAANQQVRDYYLLPFVDLTWERLRLAEINATLLDGYRIDSLDFFLQMTRRTPLPL